MWWQKLTEAQIGATRTCYLSRNELKARKEHNKFYNSISLQFPFSVFCLQNSLSQDLMSDVCFLTTENALLDLSDNISFLNRNPYAKTKL